MTPPISAAVTLAAQTAATQPQAIPTSPQFAQSDLERLRALVANTAPPSSYEQAAPPAPPEVVDKSTFQTMGDSILQGISSFNRGYHEGLESINNKLKTISRNDTLSLGNNFADIMGLQVEIARWSMSVMGVDNASKAGTNTVKELSKGA
jgi:hypothetical protein